MAHPGNLSLDPASGAILLDPLVGATVDAVAITSLAPTSTTLRTYLSYGIGMTGNQILRDVPTAMLLFYMTNALLIPAAYAGFAILLPKVWVLFADPLVGVLSDRTHSRWGARKPFLFVGSIVATLTFIALFVSPVPKSPAAGAVVVGLFYTLLATGYSIYSVPYLALAAELGSTPGERTTALAYKQVFCLVGVVAGLAMAPWLVDQFGGGRPGYRMMAEIIGALLFATTMATALLLPAGRSSPGESTQLDLFRKIKDVFAHKPFRIVFIASALQLLAFGIGQAGGLYYLIYNLRMPMTMLGVNVVGSVVGSAVGQPIWVKLSVRYGTIPIYRIAAFFAAVTTGAMILLPAGAAVPYALLGLLIGAGTGGFSLMSFSALIEAIAQDGPDSDRKGLFAAAYSAMEKAMLALGGFVLAVMLSTAHFIAGASREAQPAGVAPALILAIVVVPTVLKLISVGVLRFYPK